MQNKVIQFSYNWNNKLENKAFTTIRLHNPAKYVTGENYTIQLNETEKGTAILTDKRTLKIDQLNEFICHIDTGYNKAQTIEILQRMYKNTDLNKQLFDLCLLVYCKPEKQPPKQLQTVLNL